jgi:NTE family protein
MGPAMAHALGEQEQEAPPPSRSVGDPDARSAVHGKVPADEEKPAEKPGKEAPAPAKDTGAPASETSAAPSHSAPPANNTSVLPAQRVPPAGTTNFQSPSEGAPYKFGVVTSSGIRPRIGLVLSGGGARGAAHIGVLKVLEEMKVPIDAIAGTSMGAVVGGLYASGLTAKEIESVMTSVNWTDAFRDTPPRSELNFRRKQEDQNFLVEFPLGIRAGRILLPKGLIQGQKLNQMLRRMTLPAAKIEDFDSLPTPFRAVATDLVTGEGVIMGEGDLPTAMRASLSAPGVFAPVERNGQLLVDGGISENLPIDVARTMNVDVLIVVDVGFPLYSRDKLGSAPVVSNQMLAILIRRDSQRQRATLTEKDIVIDPALGDAPSYDFAIVKRAVKLGEEAAWKSQPRLAQLSLTDQEYQYYANRRDAARADPPHIDFVHVEANSRRYAYPLHKMFDEFIGETFDADAMNRKVTNYYGRGNLEMLDYQIVKEAESYGLEMSARRNSWGPNYVRFGLNLQDDFDGNARYNAATRFIFSEITEPGGEWVLDLQIGESPQIATEVYLPFTQTSRFFVLPHARFRARNVPQLDNDQNRIADFRVRTFDYGLDFGREFGNWGEIRTGVTREVGHSRIRVGDPTIASTDFDSKGYFVRLTYDRLDDVNFPRRGQQATLEWNAESTDLGENDRPTDRVLFDYLIARSFGRNTAVLWTSFGTSLDEPNPADLRTLFPLGGFFNLSGLQADSIYGPHFGIARTLLYRQIGRGGSGFLDFPTYLGFSFEAGNVWQERSQASFGSARKNGSIFLGLDTFLGPVYLATGFDQDGRDAFYLFLGRTF